MHIPQVGFGLWQIIPDRGNREPGKPVDNEYAAKVIKEAIDVGYRHLDSAWFYGIEEALGMALKQVLSDEQLKKSGLFITTKIWNTFHSRERVVENMRMSLKEMGLDYVDLALMHFPVGYVEGDSLFPIFPENMTVIPWKWEKDAYLETWKGMEDIIDQGLAKAIGVANFNRAQLKKILDVAKTKPVMNQVFI
jgi:aldehyde reductase